MCLLTLFCSEIVRKCADQHLSEKDNKQKEEQDGNGDLKVFLSQLQSRNNNSTSVTY